MASIRIRGARTHNLRDVSVEIPRDHCHFFDADSGLRVDAGNAE